VRGPSTEFESSGAAAGSPAVDAYLRGKVRVSSENPADNEAAIAALSEAIALDDTLAPAYAELSRALTIKAFYFAPDSARKRLHEDAAVALEKALSLDSRLGAAHLARGLMIWTPARRFPHQQAVQAYRQALAFDSTLDEAHHQLALVYMHVGLLDEAQVEVDKALAINPANTLADFRRGVIALYRNDFERAHAVFNGTPPDRNPTLWGFQAATVLFRLNREQEAADLLDRVVREDPDDQTGAGHSVRAMMMAKAGRVREAEAEIARAIETGRNFGHFHHTAYNVASAYAMLGQEEQAIRWLRDAAENGFPCYPLFATDTQLDRIRDNPRFQAFMAQLKRDWEERRRTL
jgi:serine/threonine-protein kinase